MTHKTAHYSTTLSVRTSPFDAKEEHFNAMLSCLDRYRMTTRGLLTLQDPRYVSGDYPDIQLLLRRNAELSLFAESFPTPRGSYNREAARGPILTLLHEAMLNYPRCGESARPCVDIILRLDDLVDRMDKEGFITRSEDAHNYGAVW